MRGPARVLAVASALLFFAEPVANVLHLAHDDEGHAWCEAHGHVVHVDHDANDAHRAHASEGDDDTSPSFQARASDDHPHHECPAVFGHRASDPAPEVTEAPVEGPVRRDPSVPARVAEANPLERAPKRGPPARV